MTTPRVTVIGAGLAGLAAAFTLRERGAAVIVLEREEAVAGRARSQIVDGWSFDGGAQVLESGARRFAALARAAGVADQLLPLRPVEQLRLERGRLALPLAWRSRDAERLPERLRLARLERVVGRFRPILPREASERGDRLDDRSIAEMAALYLPERAMGGWVAPLAASWGLGDPAAASRIALMRLLAADALAPALPHAGVGLLADALARGLDVRLGAEATAVEAGAPPAGDASAAAFRVRLAGGAVLESDAVLLATPAAAARALAAPLLTPPEHDVLAAARCAPALVLHAALARPLAERPTRVGVDAGAALPLASLLLEPADVRAPAGAGAASLVASPAWSAAHAGAPDEVIAKELLAALDRIHPGASGAVRFLRIARYADALPLFPVGRYRALARFRRVQEDRQSLGRKLYFAGDWLAGPTLEDALASGLRAADEIAPPR